MRYARPIPLKEREILGSPHRQQFPKIFGNWIVVRPSTRGYGYGLKNIKTGQRIGYYKWKGDAQERADELNRPLRIRQTSRIRGNPASRMRYNQQRRISPIETITTSDELETHEEAIEHIPAGSYLYTKDGEITIVKDIGGRAFKFEWKEGKPIPIGRYRGNPAPSLTFNEPDFTGDPTKHYFKYFAPRWGNKYAGDYDSLEEALHELDHAGMHIDISDCEQVWLGEDEDWLRETFKCEDFNIYILILQDGRVVVEEF